ncbi:Soluble lamin-associated protein of 75 kDa [Sciurus carolinensis]|uniref:Soluble lamin-associated protein of 75 kDa n=1 Tax=Sciurus carolinensis TaxID=30640 RepID=A0AA41MGK8_SCICA|nr:Soluble lamin-associated protein of 75 kDa [Sciurus carolinensis]
MEKGAQGPDWDSDETVIEGSVTESDLEDEELPWRRLLFDQDTSLRSEFTIHPGISGLCKGMPSPEIQLGHKLSEGLQEQMNENKMMTVLSVDTVSQAGLLSNHRNIEEKMKMNKIRLSSINRRNVFGENLLYKAALHNDTDLVHLCIKKGANVNQPSYAGWTALHEASVGGFYHTATELLKGGADVNIKGMYQITPLHDAVINGHHKVAELLLLNGADPLFRSDNGKCALEEAKDSYMQRLLERYLPKHPRGLTSARRNSTDPEDVDIVQQHKKPKFGSKNHIGFVRNENYNRQKPEHVEVNKRSKEGSFINKEDIYEHYQKDTKSTKFGKSKHKPSTVDQICCTGLSKVSLHNDKDISTSVSKGKRRRNTQPKRTHVNDEDCSSGQIIAVSSSRRINRLTVHQQHILQTPDDLPEESCEPSSCTLSSLKNGLDNNIETYSVSKETHTPSLDLSDSQEMHFLELESVGQTEAISFSGLSVGKEIKLPPITADQPLHAHQEQHCSPYKFCEYNNSNKKEESFNKWENCFLTFIKENFDKDNEGYTSEKTLTPKEVVCSTQCESHYNCENLTNRKEIDFQQLLLSEDHFSQEKALNSVTTLQQQEVINFSDSDSILISDKHIANHVQCMYGTSFDHSHGNPEQTSKAYTGTVSTHEVSELTSHVELLKKSQDNSPREPTPLMNRMEKHIVERVYIEKKQDTERNYTKKRQITSSSNKPSPTVDHSQGVEITNVEKKRPDLTESESIHNIDFHSTDSVNKEVTIISQLYQREKEENSHKSDEELTNKISGDECAIRSYEDEKEKMDSEISMSLNTQEHKKGWTPLHEASNEGFNDIIVELLKAGANVNCENIDGILPLHDAVAGNHLKAAEILLQHGANPNQKDQNQKTALDEANNDKMEELLKSYGAIKASNRDESNATVTVKIPATRSKRHKQCFCDVDKNVDPSSLSHQEQTRESLPVHETISAILQDIEERQENLLAFEIRNPEDAEQYIKKMLEIKEIMDNVLAKQKAERDDLAKKYRVSIESFKHGALREQLANLATRQKSLLVVAKKQKKIRLKIQDYKNVTALSDSSLKKLPSSSHIFSEKDNKELTSLENSVQPQSGSLSVVNIACRSIQETPLSLKTWHDSHNTNLCPDSEAVRRGEFSGSEMNSKQNDCTLDELLKSRHPDGTDNIKLSSQPVTFFAQAEYAQKDNDHTETIAKDCEFYSPFAITGTLNDSKHTSILSQKDAHPSTVIWDQDLSQYDPKRGNRKTASQQPPGEASESWAHQGIAVSGTDTVHQMKQNLEKPTSAVLHINHSQISSSSGSGHQHTTKKPLNYSTAPKKKCVQIKDLILLGRMNPGNNVLEFKTQETIHKASVLISGKIKVENGQIYQNPVTWLKDLLGGDSYVTWNYAWSKVTYLGKELLKYVSEEVPESAEPNVVPKQHQPCLPVNLATQAREESPGLGVSPGGRRRAPVSAAGWPGCLDPLLETFTFPRGKLRRQVLLGDGGVGFPGGPPRDPGLIPDLALRQEPAGPPGKSEGGPSRGAGGDPGVHLADAATSGLRAAPQPAAGRCKVPEALAGKGQRTRLSAEETLCLLNKLPYVISHVRRGFVGIPYNGAVTWDGIFHCLLSEWNPIRCPSAPEHSSTFHSARTLCSAFITRLQVGSICASFLTQSYQLPVLDTMFVRKKFRGKDFGLHMLEDFVDCFTEDALGLRYPLSSLMYTGQWTKLKRVS